MPLLSELSLPPAGRTGWPWTEAGRPTASNGPRVSLVVPSYNQAEFLEETLRSILLQAHTDLELIVIDGGSTDGSVDIINRYAPWIMHWVSERDAGQSDAINKGLSQTSGEIVAWLNSDDTYLPGAIRAAVSYFEAHPEVDVLYRDCAFTDRGGRPLTHGLGRPYAPEELLRFSIPYQPSVLWRRTAMLSAGLLDPSYHYSMDSEYWARLAQAGARFAYLPGVSATYRLHEQSKTVSAIPKMHADWERIIRQYAAPARRAALLADARLLTATKLAQAGQVRASFGFVRQACALAWRKRLMVYLGALLDAVTGARLGHRLTGAWIRGRAHRAEGAG